MFLRHMSYENVGGLSKGRMFVDQETRKPNFTVHREQPINQLIIDTWIVLTLSNYGFFCGKNAF